MTEPLQQAVLLSGASGLIGTSLARSFSQNRIQTLRLVRRELDAPDAIRWNPDVSEPVQDIPDLSRLENLRAAIHLSGANLSAHRWTSAYKREIVGSRVRTTRALVDMLKKLKNPPRSLLCASGISVYGDRGDEVLTETSSPGQGFLADVCRAWEAEADLAAAAGMRVVHLRFGVVLAREGGALRKMLPVFRAGLGGRLGSGRRGGQRGGQQWMSWIALPDLVRAVRHILQADSLQAPVNLQGPVNLVAPIPVTNAEFTRALGRALHRPAILPVPRFALRAAFGEMADAALLSSTRVIPERLAASGFHFDFPEINAALRSILRPSARLVLE